MIITRTPFRVSFFGGGTDLPEFFHRNGGAVISTTIDKYCYCGLRTLPGFFDYSTEVCYSRTERVRSIDEIEHPAVREGMRMLGVDRIRLTYEADLPARSGLGTSSSFAVGMLEAFHLLKGESATKRQLADEAIRLERELCAESGGWQDQIAAAFGGFNRIDFCQNGDYKLRPIAISPENKAMLGESLLLFFTGFTRFSGDIHASRGREDKDSRLREMLSMVDEAERLLSCGGDRLSDFGRLLDVGWKLKRGTNSGVSTLCIDSLYERGIKAGALGGKLLGAGGGGFLLFFVEREKREAVRKALGDLIHVPFGFEHSGATVIYNE